MRTGRFRPGRTDHDAHPPYRTKPYLRFGRFFPGTRPCHHRRRHPSPTSSWPHSYYRPQHSYDTTLRAGRVRHLGPHHHSDPGNTSCRRGVQDHTSPEPTQVPRPIERPVLSGRFRGRRVHTFPPPAAGRTLLEMLNIYQRFPRELQDIDDPRGAVALAALTHQVLRDRRDRPFDPNCYAQITEKRMLQANYANLLAKQIAERVNQGRAGQGRGGGRKQSGGETTHLSVMDRWGNAVGLTQSIEHVYGSCAVSPKLGFLYNSYMSAFEYKDPSHPYYLRPNAVPWASVAPTIVFRGRRPWVVLGSPGSERITSAILQVLIRLLHDDPHHVYAAVDAPRLHCALSRVVSLESTRMDPGLGVALEQQGFKLRVRDPYAFYLGCVALVMRTHEGFLGVADPRRDGAAAGPSFTNTQHGNHAYE